MGDSLQDPAAGTAVGLAVQGAWLAAAKGVSALGTAAGDWMLESSLFGPGGPVFGNQFYAGTQGFLNYGEVRIGWSYFEDGGVLEFTIRIGNYHVPPIYSPVPSAIVWH